MKILLFFFGWFENSPLILGILVKGVLTRFIQVVAKAKE